MEIKMILCDSNIVFRYQRNHTLITNELDKIGFENLAIFTVTVCEMYFGMLLKEKRETIEIIRKFKKFYLDKEISLKVEELMSEYRDKLAMPDALIAATAICNNLKIFTLNKKDFEFIKGIEFYKPTQKMLS